MSKPRLTDYDYQQAALRLGCSVAAIKAVADVEAAGEGFDEQDRPKILFERHLFHRYTHGKWDATHPGISNPNPGGYGPSRHQYDRFNEAFALDPIAAMMAASWGKFQVLGSNFAIVGFRSVGEFVDAMKTGEPAHLAAFVEFVIHNHLDDELTDFATNLEIAAAQFARVYNGGNYRLKNYDGKIVHAYRRHRMDATGAVTITSSEPAPDPPARNDEQDPPTPVKATGDDTAIEQPQTQAPIASMSQTTTTGADGSTNSTTTQTVQPVTLETSPPPSFIQEVSTTLTTKITAVSTFLGGLGILGTQLMQKAQDALSEHIGLIVGIGLVALGVYYLKTRQDKAHETQLALIQAAANPLTSTVTVLKPKALADFTGYKAGQWRNVEYGERKQPTSITA